LSHKRKKRKEHTETADSQQEPSCHQTPERACFYSLFVQGKTEGNQHAADEKNYWERQLRIAKWLNGITFFGTLVALGALVFLYGTFDAARKQWEEMHHSLLVDQRAWMGFDEIKEYIFKIDKPFSVLVPLKNIGKTPANNVSGAIAVRFAMPGERIDFDGILTPLMGPPNGFFLPSQSLEVLSGGKDKITGNIPKAWLDKVNSGQGIIYVFGKVTYTDIFKVDHWTRYCMGSEPNPIGGIRFRQCRENYHGIDSNEE
jgi:hypothetical protein